MGPVPTAVASVASSLLAGAFAWSSIAKIARPLGWSRALRHYRLAAERFLLVAVPGVEAGTAALLLLGATRAGGALSLALLGAFSLAVVRARSFEGDRLPCGCFGRAEARDYRTMLARNAVLGALAGAVLAPGRDLAFLEGLHAPASDDAVPFALVIVGLGVAARAGWIVSRSLRSGR